MLNLLPSLLNTTGKNPGTGGLHLQIHPSAVRSLHIAPLPASVERQAGQLFPEGGNVEDLVEVRKIVYGLQRQGIRPELVYPHGESSSDATERERTSVWSSRAGLWSPSCERREKKTNETNPLYMGVMFA